MSNSLPSGYAKVAYIGSTGTQFINTGVVMNGQDSVEIKGQYVGTRTSTSSWQWIYGTHCSSHYIYMGILYDNFMASAGAWSINDTIQAFDNDSHVFCLDYATNKASIDGVSKTLSTQKDNSHTRFTPNEPGYPSEAGQRPLLIFARSHGGDDLTQWTASGKAVFNLEYAVMKQGDTVIRNYVPCLRQSDFKPGLYDLVNDVFYTNAGTGEFIYEIDSYKTIIHTADGDIVSNRRIVNGNHYDKKLIKD